MVTGCIGRSGRKTKDVRTLAVSRETPAAIPTPATQRTPDDRSRVIAIPLDKLRPMPGNRDVGDVTELAKNLRANGQRTACEVRTWSGLQELPPGCYELIAGHRRMAAAELLGWNYLDCVYHDEMDDRAAVACRIAENLSRRDMTQIDLARAADQLLGLGLSPAEVGERLEGRSAETIDGLVRLLKLPEDLQNLVATGRVPVKVARALVPYAELGTVMAAACDQLSGEWCFWRNGVDTDIKRGVQGLVARHTRPMDGKRKHDYGYQVGTFGRLFKRSPELDATLHVATVRIDNKPVEVALDVEAFDELNLPLAKAKAKAKETKEKRKPEPGQPLTPAQQQARDEDQDQQLADRIGRPGGLAEQALRLAIAGRLACGTWQTEWAYDLLAATARNSESAFHLDLAPWKHEAERLLAIERRTEAPPDLANPLFALREDWAKYSIAMLRPDEDPVSDLQRIHWWTVRMLLWPVRLTAQIESRLLASGDEMPTKLPAIPLVALAKLGELANVTVRSTWNDAADNHGGCSPDRIWLTAFLDSHTTRRHVEALWDQTGCGTAPESWSVKELRAQLLQSHGTTGRLSLPKVLAKWQDELAKLLEGRKKGRKKIHELGPGQRREARNELGPGKDP